MFDPLLISLFGIVIFVISIMFGQYVRYIDNRSPKIIEKEAIIREKIQNNEELTKSESFHFYSYFIWNAIIKIGIYGGILAFLSGCLITLIK